jgi:hypothetical protein
MLCYFFVCQCVLRHIYLWLNCNRHGDKQPIKPFAEDRSKDSLTVDARQLQLSVEEHREEEERFRKAVEEEQERWRVEVEQASTAKCLVYRPPPPPPTLLPL